MKYLRTFNLIIIFIIVSGFHLFGQDDVQTLPQDPRVRTGKLANGLTYYAVENKAVKGTADFAVIQKVGTVVEENNQKGMCKLLELLATRGTRNFTDSTIVKYLNSIGVDSKNLVFKTGQDQIEYGINNVPISNNNTMDSVLLIMYNWMSSINIDEEDIMQATPMLKNIIKDEWNAEKRINDKIIKNLYPDSPYSKSITLNQINTMGRFSSKDLRNFYYNWFRPDLQAVFVVGDINLNTVETQIKSIFATIPKPLKAKERNFYKPEIFKGTKVLVESDPEYSKTLVSVDFLIKPMEEKYRLTSVPYIETFFDSAISSLLLSRIQSGIVSQNLPILNLKIEKGSFMDIKNLEKFSISFETQPESVYSALSFISGEINRMARYGFNKQEFANSRDMHFRELEYIYDNRLGQPNSLFMKRVVNNFLNGYSLASIEMHFEIMKEIIYSITAKQLNLYAEALLGNKDGVVITCKMPEIKGVPKLSNERIEKSFTESIASSSNLKVDDVIVNWPIFTPDKEEAEIINEIDYNFENSKEIVLSNGVKVILKKTQSPDTISFRAVSKGGLAVMDKDYISVSKYINDIVNLGGLDNIPFSDWNKLFAYNNLKVLANINENTEELYGYSGKQSLEKLLHVINLNFTHRRMDEDAFNIYKKAKISELTYRNMYPMNVFKDSVSFFNSNRQSENLNKESNIENLDYSKLFNDINKRFSNAADFTFIFAGDINFESFKILVKKYLGSIATNNNTEEFKKENNFIPRENIDKNFLFQMIIPRTYIDYTLWCEVDQTLENYVLGEVLRKYLSGLYINGRIKELSPKSRVEVDMNYLTNTFMCKSVFETDSAGISAIKEYLGRALNRMTRDNISGSKLDLIKKDLKNNFSIKTKENRYWIDVISNKVLTDKDFYTNYTEILEGITPDKLRTFIDKVYRRGVNIAVVMEGTSEDVNTQNLFRENEMIKKYFEL